ncbi:MAG: IclR family transcriptional regulator [Lautropia sp.]
MPARSRTAEPSTPAAPAHGDDRLFIGSVAKCFRVLELLNASDGPLGLVEIARQSGLGKSAAQRATHTLRELGYLRQHPDTRAYALSSKMLDFTHTVLAQDRVRSVAMPALEALNRHCGETVNLTRLEGEEVVYVARFPSMHAVSVDLHIGSRLPAFCTSPGRAMLSRMPAEDARRILDASRRIARTPHTETGLRRILDILQETRRRGYAVNDQESHVGDVSIAAAIVDGAGRVAGAINIAAPSPRWTIVSLQRRFSGELMWTATEVSKAIGVL